MLCATHSSGAGSNPNHNHVYQNLFSRVIADLLATLERDRPSVKLFAVIQRASRHYTNGGSPTPVSQKVRTRE
jgi:hypothetical protein